MKIPKVLPLAVLLVSGIAAAGHVPRARADEGPKVITITAKRFEFVPSAVTLKKGETVKLRVASEDVTHGLFLRAFHLDSDLVPGETQEMTVTPQTAGTFVAICHHFCGAQHGNMKLTFVVE